MEAIADGLTLGREARPSGSPTICDLETHDSVILKVFRYP